MTCQPIKMGRPQQLQISLHLASRQSQARSLHVNSWHVCLELGDEIVDSFLRRGYLLWQECLQYQFHLSNAEGWRFFAKQIDFLVRIIAQERAMVEHHSHVCKSTCKLREPQLRGLSHGGTCRLNPNRRKQA